LDSADEIELIGTFSEAQARNLGFGQFFGVISQKIFFFQPKSDGKWFKSSTNNNPNPFRTFPK